MNYFTSMHHVNEFRCDNKKDDLVAEYTNVNVVEFKHKLMHNDNILVLDVKNNTQLLHFPRLVEIVEEIVQMQPI